MSPCNNCVLGGHGMCVGKPPCECACRYGRPCVSAETVKRELEGVRAECSKARAENKPVLITAEYLEALLDGWEQHDRLAMAARGAVAAYFDMGVDALPEWMDSLSHACEGASA